ncbi:PBSX family phage terminase large subunit [Hominenteromicrobium sp.]|uniref:PBSX family phage terminase large subunit n=1 Tax=Hominenteromicrobium sp. TaxID=3073581 RepID=UPI002058C753|nr:MAG TPA: large terminase [Caudoviricetes sp.]
MHYEPFSQKQLATLCWWNWDQYKQHDALICDGSIRSGKTLSMSVGFVLWSMTQFSGQNFAISGKTIESLRRNVILQLPHWLEGLFVLSERRSENLLTITAGGRTNRYFLFGGRDESSYALIQGMTLAGVLFDEVALMPRSFVEQALARCSVGGSRFWFNCNPEAPSHWFYEEWILKAQEKNALHLHFTMEDNLSLPAEIKRRYESMYSGVFYDRYIRGEWVVAEGRVYRQFADNPDAFILHGPTTGMDGQFYISIDYGTINPFSMGLWCVQNKRATRIKEWYYDSRKESRQKTDEEYYEALEAFTQGYYIRKVIVDPSAASFLETIRRHGKFSAWDADNDVLDGIRVTSSLLSAGMIQIHDSCKDAIREFGLYRWDEKKHSDTVLKENDHAMDDIRYFCYTILAREFRWAEWKRGG